jgi:hypothetical protein
MSAFGSKADIAIERIDNDQESMRPKRLGRACYGEIAT